MRAYHVEPAGAGYTGRVETIIDGSADRWFRPSDVCVAPDGALIVADWYDPGVGGHGMGDTEKGRIYRIAPRDQQGPIAASGANGSIPPVDFKTVAGCVTALASPNLCTRATAFEQLGTQPPAAKARPLPSGASTARNGGAALPRALVTRPPAPGGPSSSLRGDAVAAAIDDELRALQGFLRCAATEGESEEGGESA